MEYLLIKCAIFFTDMIDRKKINDPKLLALATVLVESMGKTVVAIKADDFQTKESRNTIAARKAFADNYSTKYDDLILLYDTLRREAGSTDSSEFYFQGLYYTIFIQFLMGMNVNFYSIAKTSGVPGKEFEAVGPRVELGQQPYELAPAAHKEWATKEAFLPREGAASDPGQIFTHDICGIPHVIRHIKHGLAVLEREHVLLKEMFKEYFTSPETTISSKYLNLDALITAIRYQVIRMFWPGRSHMIYSDPRPGSRQKKSFFHKTRQTIANEYMDAILADVLHKLPKAGRKRNITTAKWKKTFLIDSKSFSRLRTNLYFSFAAEIGFGEPWFRNVYQKRTSTGSYTKDPKSKPAKEGPYGPDDYPIDVFRKFPKPAEDDDEEGADDEDEIDNDDDDQ
jgi:hypothetical protein